MSYNLTRYPLAIPMADCPALIVGLTPSSTLNKETDALLVPVACSAVGPAAPSKLASLWKFLQNLQESVV